MKSYFPYILISIFLFGISTFFRKLALDKMHPYQLQVVSGYVYLVMTPIWLYILNSESKIQYSTSGVIFGIICGLLYTAGSVCFGFVLKNSPNIGVSTALVSLSPIITLSLSFIFLHEKFSVAKLIAFVLAVLSAILVNF